MKSSPTSIYHRIHNFSRTRKQALMAIADVGSLVFAVWAAYSLRLADWFIPNLHQSLLMIAAPLIAIPVFIKLGLYRSVIRYVGEQALWAILKGMTIAALLWMALVFTLGATGYAGVPRSIPLLYWLVGSFLIGGSRFFARWLLWHPIRERFSGRQVLIYGAGEAGRQLAHSLRQGSECFPAGFIDDDVSLHHQDIDGFRVYSPAELGDVIEHFDIRDVIVTESSLTPDRRKAVLTDLQKHPVHVRVLPAISEIASGRYLVQSLRELEIGDLLGRAPVPPNPALTARNIAEKTVLVTGAGGSIGSELCRQIMFAKPKKLVLVDHHEYNLYAIHSELTDRYRPLKPGDAVGASPENTTPDATLPRIVPHLASVCDGARMQEIFALHRPETVYHAAAYKHVPLVEANPREGLRNNIFGTLTVAKAAMQHQVADVVLVSTDKAVRPTNIMGASKRVAEMVLQAFAHMPILRFDGEGGEGEKPTVIHNHTRFSMVRFGNVLDSSGSVVPLFKRQIREGGPVTVTDGEVTRYFMTIPEAAQLVIQAGAMAEGGDVFILDMGEPVKIIDLARRMIELSGLQVRDTDAPDGDIEIRVIGLRAGEKLYEELLIGEESQTTAHPRIWRAKEAFMEWEHLKIALQQLEACVQPQDVSAMQQLLANMVEGYEAHPSPRNTPFAAQSVG